VAEFTIEAEKRTIIGKQVNRLRAQGFVPITVYGAKIAPISLQVPYRPLEIALMQAGGTNLIDLKVNGDTHVVLVREVQRDVLKGTILHADFFVVDQTSKIRAEIPVHLIGESPVVAAREGILLTGTNTVTVETLPSNLMDHIEVDLSKLVELGDSITVADLDLGDDVTIINEPEDMLARVAQTSAARAELLEEGEEGEEEEEVDEGAEPEVISRGRAEEEDE
jgi:large subunit ribosomal protein L25